MKKIKLLKEKKMKLIKKKIGIDLDDTLFDLIGPFINYHNQNYKTNLKKEDFTTYPFNEVLKLPSIRDAVERVFRFYDSDFFRKMPPLPGSVEAINKIKEDYDIHIITYRPEMLYNDTMNQIWNSFRNCFSEVFFAFNPYLGRKSSGNTKGEICLNNGIFKMIDDSLECILDCQERGISGLLFGDYSWNQNGEHKGITRVNNWKEVLEKLKIEE
jgi:5'(3')-deoxyribonucleotidase